MRMLAINRVINVVFGFMGCLAIFLPNVGFSQEIVTDPGAYFYMAQEVAKDAAMLTELGEQGTTLKNQWETAKQQYEAMKGNYGWGSWNTQGQDFTNKWQWTANNWQDQLKGLAGGNSSRYQELKAQYLAANDSMTEDQFHKTFSAPVAKALANEVSTNQAAGTASQMSFEQVNTHVTELQSLAQEVENPDKNLNTKSAIDINTRAQIQNGLIASEMVRAQALNNNIAASKQASDIANAVRSAQFNLDPPH
jgi:hypothetical protein